jgi:tRNA 2-selenouridine synthase SelU
MKMYSRRPSLSLESHLEQQQPFCYQEETAEDASSEVPLLEQLQEGAKHPDHYQERNSTLNHPLRPQKSQRKVENLKKNHLQKTNPCQTFLSKANPQGKNLQRRNH